MTTYKRIGNRWTINECLQLQREFELLELSIDKIAERHQRTPNAIMCKLDQEGLADYNILYSNYHNLNDELTAWNNVTLVVEDEDVIQDEDENISSYSEQDCVADHCSSNEEGLEEEDSNDDSYDNDSLKKLVMRLEKQLGIFTEMMIQQSKGKKVFSLFD